MLWRTRAARRCRGVKEGAGVVTSVACHTNLIILLGRELAELDIKCTDLTDQRDRFQILVNEMNDCREHYEHFLLKIQSLQTELHSNTMQTDRLQHEMDMYKVDETVQLCDSILNGTARSHMPNPCLNLNYSEGSVALHTGLPDEDRGRTVIYSDDLGVGLGPMLGNWVGHRLVEKNFDVWEDSWNAIGVFCDLSKAFDWVNHKTLTRKLHHYGVTGRALDLLASYLTNRVNNLRSSGSVVHMGVPQNAIECNSEKSHRHAVRTAPHAASGIGRKSVFLVWYGC
ncbi:hypothetical protein EVAR_24540_1 [Eumeta japonica]|uniref:Reverse transcriptase domain-containing protein n=1 Tax=Eumeta variegata TaxID=151549 RepID=A0A4C1USS4_EUMVA|nr:hypothetical protein EVAR_24540_1 [Eumeta japonica]